MSDARATDESGERNRPASLRATVYRYFFYGWLFRDASIGSALERAAALRHNRLRARWLPTYLRRWLVCGGLLLAFETWTEQALANAFVSAAIAVALILVLVFLVVTTVCWTMLREGGRRGG